MGTSIFSMTSEFRIRRAHHFDALLAIKALVGGETVTKSRFPGMKDDDHYAFVTTKEFAEAETLQDALAAWRWVFEEDVDGDLYGPMFMGESLGDEHILFPAIAPFVQDGSYIQVFCPDRESVWRWVFESGQVRTEAGRIEFDY